MPNEKNSAEHTAGPLDGDGAFVRVVFHGDRFAGGMIPVEALPELAAYRSAIVAAAKGLYRARQKGRIRVPAGFEASIQLVLSGEIGDGSAVATVHRVRPPAADGSQVFPIHDEVDDAVEYLESYLAAVVGDTALPNSLSSNDQERVARTLAALGRYLKDDEAIETRTDSRATGVKYTKVTRRKLAGRTGRQDLEVDFDNVSGTVIAVRVDEGNRFWLDLGDLGTDLSVAFDPDRHDPLVMNLPNGAPIPVTLSFTALMDAQQDRITRIQDVSNLTVDDVDAGSVYPPPGDALYSAALDELGSMTDGWFDGLGRAPGEEALAWATGVLREACGRAGIPLPWLYPTAEGGLRAEWEIERARASAVFDPEDGVVRLFKTNLDHDSFSEEEIEASEATLERIAAFLADLRS